MRRFALAMVMVSSGCAAGTGAPFHVYQSPLLQAEFHPAERRARPFEPMNREDVGSVETTVVSSNELKRAQPRQTEVDSGAKVETRKPNKPSLSVIAPTRVGSRPEDTGRKSTGDWEPLSATRFVVDVMQANGVELKTVGVADVYKHCKAAGRVRHADPKVGDVVFFHNVFDATQDGRNNDWYTHIGVVEGVEGTVAQVLGWKPGGLHTFKLDASRPKETTLDGGELNSRLREPSPSDPPFTEYHAGQLFAGFCDLLETKENLVLIEGWQP